MTLLEIGTAVSFSGVNSLEEPLNECLDLVLLEGPGVISVDGIENRFVDFGKLFFVDEDVCEILDGLLEIHSENKLIFV